MDGWYMEIKSVINIENKCGRLTECLACIIINMVYILSIYIGQSIDFKLEYSVI